MYPVCFVRDVTGPYRSVPPHPPPPPPLWGVFLDHGMLVSGSITAVRLEVE